MLSRREEEQQERRAANLIWNGAGDYSIKPDLRAYDREGLADVYMNTVIGAVHRYYDYGRIGELLQGFAPSPRGEDYRELVWLGLENCAYQRLRQERPAMEGLRLAYARSVEAQAARCREEDLSETERLKLAHYRRALGGSPSLTKRERGILDGLEFGPELDTGEILEGIRRVLRIYYMYIPNSPEQRRGWSPFLGLGRRGAGGLGAAISGSPGAKGKPRWKALLSPGSMEEGEVREYAEEFFGLSIYGEEGLRAIEERLCRDKHRGCTLHFTRGEYRPGGVKIAEAACHREAVMAQAEKNREYYRRGLLQNRLITARLAQRIRNCMLVHLEESSLKARSGRLRPDIAWRGAALEDGCIFLKPQRSVDTELSVDILLDASSSQLGRQERVASQAYIVAESLSRCGIPVRISAFFSIKGCTVLRIFRDYEETDKNSAVFQYAGLGWNRDGLALRALGSLIQSSRFARRLLIILSDAKPSDSGKIPAPAGGRKGDYSGEPAILDTAMEVERLRRQGVLVMCIFTGAEPELPAARRIYGRDLVRIHAIEQFADAVSGVLLGLIGSM